MPKYNIVKDLTQDLIQVSSHINGFPKDIKIVKATLIEKSGVNYLDVDFEVNDIIYNINIKVYNDLSGAVNEILGYIKAVYERMIKE